MRMTANIWSTASTLSAFIDWNNLLVGEQSVGGIYGKRGGQGSERSLVKEVVSGGGKKEYLR